MRNFTKMGLAVLIVALVLVAAFVPLISKPSSSQNINASTQFVMGADGFLVPHYFGPYPNYATSQLPNVIYNPDGSIASVSGGIRKFVDSLPGLGPSGANNLGNYIPIAAADTTTYPGCEYYEIALVEYKQQFHSDLGLTTLRGYVQLETPANYVQSKHVQLSYPNGTQIFKADGTPAIGFDNPLYLGPFIIAQKDMPVRVTFYNLLPTGADGDLFIPVDKSQMGAGEGPIPGTFYSENRATIHLHGGRTPWISDGTPNQWITPAGEDTQYPEGVSVYDVPDMPDPGPGAMTFYYTNEQSARLMFYHDHAYGITRLNVYAGEAAGYLLEDEVEKALVSSGIIPSTQIPLVIQDKTFVPDNTTAITNMYGTFSSQLMFQDPTWDTDKWGNTSELWYPHVYMTMTNAGDPSGMNPYGRWHYLPWFFPSQNPTIGPASNPYYDPANPTNYMEPQLIPGTPNPSAPGEAFMDTPVVNGVAYPYLDLEPQSYRFRILNAADDRSFNLQLYVADSSVVSYDGRTNTEVKMVPAITTPGFPDYWPSDGRAGGVPDPATVGPEMIQIGTEGGFLPTPVVLQNKPIGYNLDPGTFDVGNVNQGTLIISNAERADVIIDFSQYAGKTLILYNDAPAPYPAIDPRQDYYTGHPDLTDSGGSETTLPGYGSNTRTVMQIRVANTTPAAPFDLNRLMEAFTTNDTHTGVFAASQPDIIVPQAYYDSAYNQTFPADTFVRINDESITFTPMGSTTPVTLPFQNKALHDEMGAAFDRMYGRMAVNLGLEVQTAGVLQKTAILYGYTDPVTEVMAPDVSGVQLGALADGTQIWSIVHNGVDTHPVHWHMMEVQLINRVAWDNNIREADANELGWKETLRVSPLQNTIVALRPIIPTLPFDIPNSVRLIDPTKPEGTLLKTNAEAFSPNAEPITIYNHKVNFGWEYVYHCHILAHEENDMMRSIAIAIPPKAPTELTGSVQGGTMVLNWKDNSLGETGFLIQRATDPDFINGLVTFELGKDNSTYTDTTIVAGQSYYYRVVAINLVGDTWDYRVGASPTVQNFPTVTVASAPTNTLGPTVTKVNLVSATVGSGGITITVQWTIESSGMQTGFIVQRATNQAFTQGLRNFTVGASALQYTDATLISPGTTYYYRVVAMSGSSSGTWSNVMSVTTPV